MSTLFEKLLKAKVPQLLGTYLAVGFGFLQFIEFVGNRYSFSSTWVDRYLLAWLGIIPMVALLIYYRGLPKQGETNQSSLKRGLIFANVIIVGLLILLLPNQVVATQEAEVAQTEKVSFVDQDGVSKERIIPSRSSVQKIGVFPFENATGNTNAQDLWGVAYGILLQYSLRQRPEVIARGPLLLNSYYDRFGIKPYEKVNFATKRKIAEKARIKYFVSLEHNTQENSHDLQGAMYRTKDGKEVLKLSAKSETSFEAVDRLKAQIDDFLPSLGDAETYVSKLPSAALITDAEAALLAYTEGSIAFDLNPGDLNESIRHFAISVAEDPACAACAYALGDKYYGQGKVDTAKVLFTKAARLAEVLPERDQFLYKNILLRMDQKYEATTKIMEAYRRLYPYDFYPYLALENYYTTTYGLDSTIHLMQIAAEISDRQLALGKLYSLYIQKEDFSMAEKVAETAQEEFPDEEQYRMRKAFLLQEMGQVDQARELLKEMIDLDPLNVAPLYNLSSLENRIGNYTKAEALLLEVLEQANTIKDSTNAYNSLISVYASQGRIAAARKQLAEFETFSSRFTPINRIQNQNFYTRLNLAIKVNDQKGIQQAYENIAKYDPSLANIYECLIPFSAIMYNYGELPDARSKLEDCSEALASLGELYTDFDTLAKRFYAQEYKAAAKLLQDKKLQGITLASEVATAFINRLAGNYDAANKVLEKALLKTPKDPELLLEYAYLENAKGNSSSAREYAENVLTIYEQADVNFLPAQRAKSLLAEIDPQ